jgi:hypothetical protein
MALTKVQPAMIGTSTSVQEQLAFSPGVAIYENVQTISSNYTISAGNNAMSTGPITIANGVTLIVPDGSVWTVV